MNDEEHGADDSMRNVLADVQNAKNAQPRKHYAMRPWQRQGRKPRKPPSNPVGWSEGKSTLHDIAQRPNRVIVINGEQVRSSFTAVALTTTDIGSLYVRS